MLRKAIKCILFSFIMCCSLGNAYAKGSVHITQLGDQGISYIVNFTGAKATISRDGSFAMPVKNGAKVTLPGKYYICIEASQGVQIQTFTISKAAKQDKWEVKNEGALDEILKYALENHEEQVVLNFEYGNFTINTMQKLIQDHIQDLMLTYPALTYTGGTIEQIGNNNPTVTVKLKYPIKSAENMLIYDEKAFIAIENLIQNEIKNDMNTFEREEALFNGLMEGITYSRKLVNGTYITHATPLSHTLWGGIVDGKAVCDGYAKSLMYSLNIVGIPNKIIMGTAAGEDHAWNLVKLEDDYYHVDLTWADQDENTIGVLPSYFNELDSFMEKSHQWDHTLYPSTSQNTYCGPFAPFQTKGLYKVQSMNELSSTLSKIKSEKMTNGTLVLLNLNSNKWQTDKVVANLSSTLGKGIRYTTENKYDTLIVGYQVK